MLPFMRILRWVLFDLTLYIVRTMVESVLTRLRGSATPPWLENLDVKQDTDSEKPK